MTVQESKGIGGKQIFKAATVVFALYEISLFYKHTKGDFANGILFFLQSQMNLYFIMFIVLYFLSMVLAGRQAGYKILIEKKRYFEVVLLNALITSAVTLALFQLAIHIMLRNEPQVLDTNENIQLVVTSFLILFVVFIIAWLWAVREMERFGTKCHEHAANSSYKK